jgi:hypothetical protein
MMADEFDQRDDGGKAAEETVGLVVVPGSEGEYVVPASDAQAMVSPAGAGSHAEPVTWSFPVEIEVIGELSEEQLQAVAKHVFDELNTALRGVG